MLRQAEFFSARGGASAHAWSGGAGLHGGRCDGPSRRSSVRGRHAPRRAGGTGARYQLSLTGPVTSALLYAESVGGPGVVDLAVVDEVGATVMSGTAMVTTAGWIEFPLSGSAPPGTYEPRAPQPARLVSALRHRRVSQRDGKRSLFRLALPGRGPRVGFAVHRRQLDPPRRRDARAAVRDAGAARRRPGHLLVHRRAPWGPGVDCLDPRRGCRAAAHAPGEPAVDREDVGTHRRSALRLGER